MSHLASQSPAAQGTAAGRPRRLGLLGGTFDPIHYGHLIAAQTACEGLALDGVLFVPCGIPPHKDAAAVAPAADRLALTTAATADNPRFKVSRVEIDRSGPSYTYDTLALLSQQYEGDEWFVLIGLDAFAGIFSWHRWEDLFHLAEFVVVGRPGYNGSLLEKTLARLTPGQRQRVRSLSIPSLDISSTDIRRRIRAGRSVRYLLPEAVRRIIKEKGLYTNNDSEPHAT